MPEQYEQQAPYAVGLQDDTREEFERWRFSIDDIIIEKEYNLLGFFWDKSAKKGEGAWVESGEARVNKVGAKAIISAMSTYVSKISTLTQLNIDEILMEVRMLATNLNRLFLLHHEKYGIKSPTDGQTLLWDIVWFAFNGLKQSEGGAAMKSLAEAGQTIRHVYTEQPAPSKGGLLHLPGRKKE